MRFADHGRRPASQLRLLLRARVPRRPGPASPRPGPALRPSGVQFAGVDSGGGGAPPRTSLTSSSGTKREQFARDEGSLLLRVSGVNEPPEAALSSTCCSSPATGEKYTALGCSPSGGRWLSAAVQAQNRVPGGLVLWST